MADINALTNAISKLGLGNHSKNIAKQIVKTPGQQVVQRIEGWGGEEEYIVNDEELKRQLGIKGGRKHRKTHKRRRHSKRRHTRRH
jgi:hypothetical protein